MQSEDNLFRSLGARWLPLFLIVITVGYYFSFLYQNAVNIPVQDDIYDVLETTSRIVKSQDWQSAMRFLFDQYNEHRTASSRLIYYGVFLAQGEIDFRTLTLLSNLALPLIIVLLYLRVRHERYKWLFLLPSTLILLQLRAYELIFWSMATFAYCYVFIYGFCCIFCLQRIDKKRFCIAALFAILASFTLASGLTIWVIGMLSLLHQRFVLKTAPVSYAVCWIFVAIGVLALWSYGFESLLTPQQALENVISAPVYHLHYFLVLLGSAISGTSTQLASVSGAVLLVSLVFISVRSHGGRDIRLELCCWYIVCSAAAIVLGRAYFSELEYAMVSRYSFPSILLLSTLLMLFLVALKSCRPFFLLLVIGGSLFYNVASYRTYSELLQPYMDLTISKFNNMNYWNWSRPVAETNAIVAEAVLLGIYRPPNRPHPMRNLVMCADGNKVTGEMNLNTRRVDFAD